MKRNTDTYLIIKVLLVGLIIAALIYLLHPDTGQFSLIINGEPVTNPFIKLAALPSLLVVLFFTVIITLAAFFGVGLYIFLFLLLFIFLSIFIMAPYAWPVLNVIFITIIVLSLGNNKNTNEE